MAEESTRSTRDTAQAFKVTQLTIPLEGASFGVDFNPAADALRIISDTGQNLRHPFAAGPLQFMTQTDMPLNNAGTTALGVTGAAYTNNDLDPNTNTTLFDIDTTLDQVSIQSPPNNGSLVATGKLTVDAGTTVGFDNYTQLRKGVAVGNNAFATLVVNGTTGFYRDQPARGHRDPYRQLLPRQARRLQRSCRSTSQFRSNSKRHARAARSVRRSGPTIARSCVARRTAASLRSGESGASLEGVGDRQSGFGWPSVRRDA